MKNTVTAGEVTMRGKDYAMCKTEAKRPTLTAYYSMQHSVILWIANIYMNEFFIYEQEHQSIHPSTRKTLDLKL